MYGQRREQLRKVELRRFLHARYGLRGTLRLHRAAFGADLLRAPLNVMLAPVYLVSRLLALLLSLVGLRRAARRLAGMRLLMTSDVARQVQRDTTGFLQRLDSCDLGTGAPAAVAQRAVADLADTRNAVSEITTSLLVLGSGILLFHRPTPGIISMAAPVAGRRAQAQAIEDFALGNHLGRLWYDIFPAQLSPVEIVITGVALALIASVVTTFAGILADPIQLWTGIHRRRLVRLLARLDRAGSAPDGKSRPPAPSVAREHLLARLGDLTDAFLGFWRH